MKRAGKSDFLCGINPKAWKADFDWLFNPTNFLKIMEGKYDNKNSANDEERFVPQMLKNPICNVTK